MFLKLFVVELFWSVGNTLLVWVLKILYHHPTLIDSGKWQGYLEKSSNWLINCNILLPISLGNARKSKREFGYWIRTHPIQGLFHAALHRSTVYSSLHTHTHLHACLNKPLACVASISTWVCWENWDESKQKGMTGEGRWERRKH